MPDRIETPALIVDLDRLEVLAARMAGVARAAGVDLRPHAKTHKTPEIAHLQARFGAVGVTVAKVGEAEALVDGGVDDVFIAYPLIGEERLERVCALAARCRLRVAADSEVGLRALSAAATRRDRVIDVRLEIDVGFGRSGVRSRSDAIRLAGLAQALPGVRLVGLMGFAGQSYEARDAAAIRDAAVDEAARLVDVQRALAANGISVSEISVGSTPTARFAGAARGATEIRPGAYVFSDRTQAALGWSTLDECALTVRATIVSTPEPGLAIADVGTKGLTSDPALDTAWGSVRGRPGLEVSWITEEHAMIAVGSSEQLEIGDEVEIIPNHACGALAMFDHMHVVKGGDVVARWAIAARGRQT